MTDMKSNSLYKKAFITNMRVQPVWQIQVGIQKSTEFPYTSSKQNNTSYNRCPNIKMHRDKFDK